MSSQKINKIIKKTAIIVSMAASLVGSTQFLTDEYAKTATKTSTQHFIAQNYAMKTISFNTASASFAEDFEGTKDVKIGNRTYKLDFIKSLKLEPGGAQKWQLTQANPTTNSTHEILTLKNMSTQALEKEYQYKTENVDLWYMADGKYYLGANEKQEFTSFDVGYAEFGFKTKEMRESGTKLFEGGFAARKVRKSDFAPTDLLGKATFNVDFNIGNPVISGEITKITMPNSLNGNQIGEFDMDIYDGKISGTGFSAKIKYKDAQATAIDGTLSGNFYGDDAAELGGSGQYSDANSMTVFGVTAK